MELIWDFVPEIEIVLLLHAHTRTHARTHAQNHSDIEKLRINVYIEILSVFTCLFYVKPTGHRLSQMIVTKCVCLKNKL
jgi:hypothetical protein